MVATNELPKHKHDGADMLARHAGLVIVLALLVLALATGP
jgi:hypothetical protein